MKTISIKNEKISASQLLYVLVLVRLCSALSTPSVSFFRLSEELAAAAVFSLLAALLVRFGFNTKALKYICAAGLLVLLAFDYIRLYAFIESGASRLSPLTVIALLVIASAYSYFCGFEAIVRTALPLIFAGLLFVITAVACSIKEFEIMNLGISPESFIPYGALDIPLLYILMSDNAEGKKERSLALGVIIPYTLTALVYAACAFSMWRSAHYSDFPVRSLFQLEGLGSALNLDVLFSAAYLMSLFFRSSLFARLGVCRY